MLTKHVEIIKENEMVIEKGAITSSIYEATIRTLLYFDLFNYPLKKDEILQFLGRPSLKSELDGALDILVENKFIFEFNEFFSVQNKRENIVRRVKGNELAGKLLPLAKQKARLIGKFPFVVSVMASGSLSKGYMDEKSDLDFFIITDPGRLWIARMLLVVYKRIFLLNSSRHFCVNYFISSDKLEIEEKNQFTATELATVIPLYGEKLYFDLIRSNGWLTGFYPNYIPRTVLTKSEKNDFFKTIFEKCINFFGGKRFDKWCMRQTQKRWERMYKHQYNHSDFEIAFKSKQHASKNHPKNYQKTVIKDLEAKWDSFAEQINRLEL
jgi:hypothetical protein